MSLAIGIAMAAPTTFGAVCLYSVQKYNTPGKKCLVGGCAKAVDMVPSEPPPRRSRQIQRLRQRPGARRASEPGHPRLYPGVSPSAAGGGANSDPLTCSPSVEHRAARSYAHRASPTATMRQRPGTKNRLGRERDRETAAMRVKSGATVDGMHFLLWYAAAIFDWMHQQQGYGEATITSGLDSAAGRVNNTLHRSGGAFDARVWAIPTVRRHQFVQAVAQYLGPTFQVLLEDDHIHVELAPQALRV